MKMTPDDPALTAYVLGELGETESTELNRALNMTKIFLKKRRRLRL